MKNEFHKAYPKELLYKNIYFDTVKFVLIARFVTICLGMKFMTPLFFQQYKGKK